MIDQKLISVEKATDCILKQIEVPQPTTLPIQSSLGKSLAESVSSTCDQPPFDQSAIDGYAFADGASAGEYRLAGEWLPGEPPATTLPGSGETYRIYTGSNLPQGVRLVMIEDTRITGEIVEVQDDPSDKLIRRQGQSIRNGDPLLAAGTPIGPAEVALLASTGVSEVSCYRSPRIAHITTGREIISHEVRKEPWQTYNSNHPLIASLLKADGFSSGEHTHIGEGMDELTDLLHRYEKHDFIFISGGASVGKYDNTARTLQENGFTIHFHKVNVRPGKPLIFAQRGQQWAFGIPGNPLSHFVSYHVFLKTALNQFRSRQQHAPLMARLTSTIKEGRGPREVFWPAQLTREEETLLVSPLPWIDSGDLAALRTANALIHISKPTVSLPQGKTVPVIKTYCVN